MTPLSLSLIPTEQLNPQTTEIDRVPTLEMLTLINQEDAHVIRAVKACLPHIAQAVDAIVERLNPERGGRLFYLGAGTSGRLGVLDASECPPTFGVDPQLVQGLIAGGDIALRHAVEGAEDSAELGRQAIEGAGVCERDAVIGLSASGGAVYVISALESAKAGGAWTGAITCNPQAKVLAVADLGMVAEVGPEVIAGSTRLKAGTAQKLILNMLSTGTMIRLGKTCQNWMVDVRPTNQKLRERAIRIVSELGQVDEAQAVALLSESGDQVKLAVLLAHTPGGLTEAELLLAKCGGRLREALEKVKF